MVVNKIFCAIKFAGQLVDTGDILGVLKQKEQEGLMIYLVIKSGELYKEFHQDELEGEVRFNALATDFGNFEVSNLTNSNPNLFKEVFNNTNNIGGKDVN